MTACISLLLCNVGILSFYCGVHWPPNEMHWPNGIPETYMFKYEFCSAFHPINVFGMAGSAILVLSLIGLITSGGIIYACNMGSRLPSMRTGLMISVIGSLSLLVVMDPEIRTSLHRISDSTAVFGLIIFCIFGITSGIIMMISQLINKKRHIHNIS